MGFTHSINCLPFQVDVMEDDRIARSGIFPTGFPVAELPPLVTTEFIAQDQGNCNPKFMRSSLYALPQDSGMQEMCGIPITLAVTPFAKLHPLEVIN